MMKKAIVVGASSGIGRGLSLLLAEKKYLVGITGRRRELLENLKSEHPQSFIVRTFDITDTKMAIQTLEGLVAELGGLDLLILSSGTGYINHNLDFENEKRIIDTNVTGFTCVTDWAFHYFDQQNHGHLVAISSVGGLRGSRIAPAYNATKAYQINYLEGLRQKAARMNKHISVTDIRPGLVDTAMAKGEGLFWVMPVSKAARQILRAILNKRKVAYVTKRWKLIAFLLLIIPKALYDRL
jgi:short-subunit dehydrogenase